MWLCIVHVINEWENVMEECYYCLYEVEAGPVVYTLFHYYRDSKKIIFTAVALVTVGS